MEIFDSKFVLDGIEHNSTLKELIESCNKTNNNKSTYSYIGNADFHGVIVDEDIDPNLTALSYDLNCENEYSAGIISGNISGKFGIEPLSEARQMVAKAITESIWKSEKGTDIGDLRLDITITANSMQIGHMSLLYNAVSSITDYAYELGLSIASFTVIDKESPFHIGVTTSDAACGFLSEKEDMHETMAEATIIYIPFDTSDPDLGGSALATLLDASGDERPRILDPDYLIDSFEIVKELYDDEIILAGRTIDSGGLVCTLERLAKDCNIGMDIDITNLQESYLCDDHIRTLFNEIPGVVIIVSDEDYGYIDSQMVLQDIAYYPIGLVSPESDSIRLTHRNSYNIADILLSIANK